MLSKSPLTDHSIQFQLENLRTVVHKYFGRPAYNELTNGKATKQINTNHITIQGEIDFPRDCVEKLLHKHGRTITQTVHIFRFKTFVVLGLQVRL